MLRNPLKALLQRAPGFRVAVEKSLRGLEQSIHKLADTIHEENQVLATGNKLPSISKLSNPSFAPNKMAIVSSSAKVPSPAPVADERSDKKFGM